MRVPFKVLFMRAPCYFGGLNRDPCLENYPYVLRDATMGQQHPHHHVDNNTHAFYHHPCLPVPHDDFDGECPEEGDRKI